MRCRNSLAPILAKRRLSTEVFWIANKRLKNLKHQPSHTGVNVIKLISFVADDEAK
jgi:hypothetical protein